MSWTNRDIVRGCMDRDAAYRETDGQFSSVSVSQIFLKNACCILCISTSNLKKGKQSSKYLENAMNRNLSLFCFNDSLVIYISKYNVECSGSKEH